MGEWLQEIQLEQYRPVFTQHGIDGAALLSLQDAFLADTLHISSKLHRSAFQRALVHKRTECFGLASDRTCRWTMHVYSMGWIAIRHDVVV